MQTSNSISYVPVSALCAESRIREIALKIETAKTNPETTDDELLRIAEEYAEMEEDSKLKKVFSCF